jgi:hypothetical protein
MITALLAQIWPYLLAAAGAVAAVLGFGASQRATGRKQAQAQSLQEAQKAVEKADDAAQKVDALDDDSVRRRASGWVRGPGK